LKHIEFNSETFKISVEDKLKKTKEKLKEITTRLDKICEKINEVDDDEVETFCPICQEIKDDVVIFSCCLNTFCNDCVKQFLCAENNNQCPLCRNVLTLKNILKTKKETNLFSKDLKLIQLLQNIPKNNSILIFALYEQSVQNISMSLKNEHIKFCKLGGTMNTISKHLHWFQDKKINILLINANNYGCGLNLTTADTIIFYQKVPFELKMQLIGRAYRYGRTCPLNIHYLYYDNEIS
jgi:SNF2 family DNA or RNA helicase